MDNRMIELADMSKWTKTTTGSSGYRRFAYDHEGMRYTLSVYNDKYPTGLWIGGWGRKNPRAEKGYDNEAKFRKPTDKQGTPEDMARYVVEHWIRFTDSYKPEPEPEFVLMSNTVGYVLILQAWVIVIILCIYLCTLLESENEEGE